MPVQFVVFAEAGQHQKLVEKAVRKDHMVNINGCDDQFYRYKMPQLVCTVLGAGASKMVKTLLANVDDVGKSLQRPPGYISNYIGYTISAKSEYDKKKVAGENCYISGHLKQEDLNPIVTQFIKDWVLCPKCTNPELNMTLKKKKRMEDSSIKFDCSACGYAGKQKKEIMTAQQKLCAYIFNNPPPISGTQEISSKQDLEEKAKKKDAKKSKKDKSGGTPRSPKPDAAAAGSEEPAPEEPAAPAAAPLSPVEKLAAIVAEGADAAAVKAIAAEATAGLDAVAAIKVVLEGLASAGIKKAPKAIKTNKALLKGMVTDAAGQGAVLGWLDNADISEPKATAKILKDLYDMELAEEEVILAWAKTARPEVQAAVKPIIEWLEEEDESSEEEA